MPNGIRYVDVEVTTTLQDILADLGSGDKFGKNQALIGILPISAGTMKFLRVTAEQWGNREIFLPAYGDPTSPGAGGWWVPPIYPEIIANSQVSIQAEKASAVNEEMRAILMLMISDNDGNYPASLTRHMGDPLFVHSSLKRS